MISFHVCLGDDRFSCTAVLTSSLQALVNFGMAAWARDSENIDLLRTLIEPALVWCANSPELDPVSTIFEMLDDNRSFFRASHLELIGKLLDSPWADQKMELVLQADPDAEPFLFLLIAFGQAMLAQLVTNPQVPAIARYLGKDPFHMRRLYQRVRSLYASPVD